MGWEKGIKWASVMAVVSGFGTAVIGVTVVDYVLRNPVGSFDVLVDPPAVVAVAVLGGHSGGNSSNGPGVSLMGAQLWLDSSSA